jgi:nitrogen fixation/metabolism regulation signal transduction histidine kinase
VDKLPRDRLREPDTQAIIGQIRAAASETRDYFTTLRRYRELVKVDRVTVDGRDLVRAAANEVEAKKRHLRVALRVEVPKEPAWIVCSPAQVHEALRCVIQNAFEAVEQAASRHPVVQILAAKEAAMFKVQIMDNGPGYPVEFTDAIWLPNVSLKEAGTGIGLAFAKAVVEGLGGSVSNFMDPGERTYFILRVPLARTK